MEDPIDIAQIEKEFDIYATRKSNSQNLLNMSLIMVLINTIIVTSSNVLTPKKIALIVVAGISILIQLVVGTILVILAAHDKEKIFCSTATILNLIVTMMTGILPILGSTIMILELA